MSGGPDLELQAAIISTLNANIPLRSVVGNPPRVHQVVPESPDFPYVTIGESQNVREFADCIKGSQIFVTLHIFSRASGYEEAKRVISALDDALDDVTMILPTHRCIEIRNDGWHVFTDNDNVTVHGVSTYRALVDPV